MSDPHGAPALLLSLELLLEVPKHHSLLVGGEALVAECRRVSGVGERLLDEEPRVGAAGKQLICFIGKWKGVNRLPDEGGVCLAIAVATGDVAPAVELVAEHLHLSHDHEEDPHLLGHFGRLCVAERAVVENPQ